MHILKRHFTVYTIIRLLLLVSVVALFVWYVLFQSQLLIAGPLVTLTNDMEVVQHDRVVEIEGTAHNVVTITLNGRDIFVDEAGSFSESLVLENGYTIMTIRAEDRYGRTTTIEHPFIYSSS